MRLNPGQIFILRRFYVVLGAVYVGDSATYKYMLYCLNDNKIHDRTFVSIKEHHGFIKLCKVLRI